MNRFTVDWEDRDLEDLANIWLNASDRDAVTKAEAKIDKLLQSDPIKSGEHVREGLHKIHVSPLIVFYSVDEDNLYVEVSGVWYVP